MNILGSGGATTRLGWNRTPAATETSRKCIPTIEDAGSGEWTAASDDTVQEALSYE